MARRSLEWEVEPNEIRRRDAGCVSRACRRTHRIGQITKRNDAGGRGAANPFSHATHLHKASSDLRQAPRICQDNGLLPAKFRTGDRPGPFDHRTNARIFANLPVPNETRVVQMPHKWTKASRAKLSRSQKARWRKRAAEALGYRSRLAMTRLPLLSLLLEQIIQGGIDPSLVNVAPQRTIGSNDPISAVLLHDL